MKEPVDQLVAFLRGSVREESARLVGGFFKGNHKKSRAYSG
jgi:hypothetical protein